jgi:hypothetical protein
MIRMLKVFLSTAFICAYLITSINTVNAQENATLLEVVAITTKDGYGKQ